MKWDVLVCRELWGTVEVEANSEQEAIAKVEAYENDSEFIPNGKLGNQGVYNAKEREAACGEIQGLR